MDLRLGIIGWFVGFLSFQAYTEEPVDPQTYLQQTIQLIQTEALNADKVDWQKVIPKAEQMAAQAETTADTYPAIRYILEQLRDRHSWLSEPHPPFIKNSSSKKDPGPSGRLIAHHVAYIDVPRFAGSEGQAKDYAQRVGALILRLQRKAPVGWVIDLRRNKGGNMWPMLAGLSTLFDQEVVGGIAFKDGTKSAWGIRPGEAFLGDETLIKVPFPKAESPLKDKPFIAVLIGPETTSAGEGVAISFKCQQNVRFFGEETYGVSTNNSGYALPDGATLYLTNGVFYDRAGQHYGGKIAPDIKVPAAFTAKSDPALDAALAWMLNELDAVVEKQQESVQLIEGQAD